MGQGGYLILANWTPYDWKKGEVTQYQMNSLTFPEAIKSGEAHIVYIEWAGFWDGRGQFEHHDRFSVTYNVQGRSGSVMITGSSTGSSNNGVHTMNVVLNNSGAEPIGWVHDGTVNCVVEGSSAGDLKYRQINVDFLSNWMGRMPEIHQRPLKQIVIPGSHDSGTKDVLGFSDSARTQNLTVKEQLEYGARFLDLRASEAQLPGKPLVMSHGDILTSTTLSSVLEGMESFLSAHPKEIVIARLLCQTSGQKMLRDALGRFIIDESELKRPYGDTTPAELYARGKNLIIVSDVDDDDQGHKYEKNIYVDDRNPQQMVNEGWKHVPPRNATGLWVWWLGSPFKFGDDTWSLGRKAITTAATIMPFLRNGDVLRKGCNILAFDFVDAHAVVPWAILNNLTSPGAIKPRQSVTDKGYSDRTRGWYDFQNQGVRNDYGRWVGDGANIYFSVALAGSNNQYTPATDHYDPNQPHDPV